MHRKTRTFVSLFMLMSTFQFILLPGIPSASAANPTIAQLTTVPSAIDSATDIAVSSDGTKLVLITGTVANPNNVIYTSSDSGATWSTSYTPSNTAGATPSYVGLSNNGQKIVVTTYTSGILYISSDGGTSWAEKDVRNIGNCGSSPTTINTTPGTEVTGFAMSGDGSIIAFPCARTTTLLLSTNSGSTFSAVTMPTTINTQGAVHISKTANASAIWVAKSDTGGLWKYTIGGSWSSNYSGTVNYPRSVTGSEDGTIVYSARGELQGNGTYTIYKSTDSGANFSAYFHHSLVHFGLNLFFKQQLALIHNSLLMALQFFGGWIQYHVLFFYTNGKLLQVIFGHMLIYYNKKPPPNGEGFLIFKLNTRRCNELPIEFGNEMLKLYLHHASKLVVMEFLLLCCNKGK